MTKAVFTTKSVSSDDDLPEVRYHFPRTCLKQVERAVGDWILYYEPRRSSTDPASVGGAQCYFAMARLTRIVAFALRRMSRKRHCSQRLMISTARSRSAAGTIACW
jgi:putative restriction endonuclease